MPNYIFPEAIRQYLYKKTKNLNKTLKPLLTPKLHRWLLNNDRCAEQICQLPEVAPKWAKEAVDKGKDIHRFVENEDIEREIDTVLKYVKEIYSVVHHPFDNDFKSKANKALRGLESTPVELLLKQASNWLSIVNRPLVLKNISKHQDTLNIGVMCWVPAKCPEELYRWGISLGGNCLNDGYYDDSLLDGSIELLALFDSNEKIQAVVAFDEGDLVEFEAKGNCGEERNANIIKYRQELLYLLNHYDYKVLDCDKGFVKTLGIIGQLDLHEGCFKCAEFRFWFCPIQEVLVSNIQGSDEYIIIDTSQSLDSENEYKSIYWELNQFYKIEDSLNELVDRFCQALSEPINSDGEQLLDLSIFHEFSINGQYWKDAVEHNIFGEGEQCSIIGDEIWWLEFADWAVNKVRPIEASPAFLNIQRKNMFNFIFRYNENPKAFIYRLCQPRLPMPDLCSDENNRLRLTASVHRGKVIKSKEKWELIKTSEDGEYVVKRRKVDDYEETIVTYQYICLKNHKVKCGVILRQLSERKNSIHIQVPGKDSYAYHFLNSAIHYNSYTECYIDHNIMFGGKYIDEYLLKNSHPIKPSEKIEGTNFFIKEYKSSCYIFNCNNEIKVLFLLDNSEVNRICLFDNSDTIKKSVFQLSEILNLHFSDNTQGLKNLDLRVSDGKLCCNETKIKYSHPNVQLTQINNIFILNFKDGNNLLDVYFSYEEGVSGDCIIDPNMENFDAVREAVLTLCNYYNICLSYDESRLFGIEEVDDKGYKMVDTTYPIGWKYYSDGYDYKYFGYTVDSDEEVYISFYQDKLVCNSYSIDKLRQYKFEIEGFAQWYNL